MINVVSSVEGVFLLNHVDTMMLKISRFGEIFYL